jgi:hypothetical protein
VLRSRILSGLGLWLVMPGCAFFQDLFTKDEPVDINVAFADTVIVLDPRDYRTRPAVGQIGVINDGEFELFITPLSFHAPEGVDVEESVLQTMTATDDHDISLLPAKTMFLEVSYQATPQVWQDGKFTVVLDIEVGAFDPAAETGSGPPEPRRREFPEHWHVEVHPVTIEFTWDCDVDGDGAVSDVCGGDDCHDQNANTASDFDEICDNADNDCDGTVDEEPSDGVVWYYDGDNDGIGVTSQSVVSCRPPTNDWVSEGGDCDDGSVYRAPNLEDFCGDFVDNDCDGVVDDGCPEPE